MTSCTLQPLYVGGKSPLCSQDGRLIRSRVILYVVIMEPVPQVPTDNHALITKHALGNFADRFMCY
jgi:hypothetical protein